MTLLTWPDQTAFATGACHYEDRPANAPEGTPRIVVPIGIHGFHTQGMLDTGGMYLLCNQEMAVFLDLPPNGGQAETVLVRGAWVRGTLHRISMTLVATDGQDLDIDATAFIPDSEERVDLPLLLGLLGCLERICFAVDPLNQVFYFGDANRINHSHGGALGMSEGGAL